MINSALSIQLQGYVPAFRDAEVDIVNTVTGVTHSRKPLLDGTLTMRDLTPGIYDIKVRHPNLFTPILERPIRIFPEGPPTLIRVPVPEEWFRNTPIRETPDADLAPVQQLLASIPNRLGPAGGKAPGEVIRAADWNGLVGALTDLTTAVTQLVSLVSPRGHDHPELNEKIAEVQGNIRRFADSFGRSHLELRREIETANLQNVIREVLDIGGATPAIREDLTGRLEQLEQRAQEEPPLYTNQLAATGNVVLTAITQMAEAKGPDAQQFLETASVRQLAEMAGQYARGGSQSRPEGELMTYQQTSSAVLGSKFKQATRGI